MPLESQNNHSIHSYLVRGVHLPKYMLDMLEPYIPHRIVLPKEEVSQRIAERVARHQSAGETTELKGGLVEYRTSSRPLVAALTDFRRDFRLYHFSQELAGKYPDNHMPLELGEGITIIDGVVKILAAPTPGALPIVREIPDGIVHARESTHMRIIALGTLHDLGIR